MVVYPVPHVPGREIAFSERDWQTYAERLIEAFPQVRFISMPARRVYDKSTRPEPLQLRASPLDTGSSVVEVSFDSAYRPNWQWNAEMGWWSCRNPPLVNATFELTGIIEYKDPPYVTIGRIYFRCRKHNDEHKAVARRALGLIRKMATNKRVEVEHPSMRVVETIEKGGRVWIGEDAARWCRENPRGTIYSVRWNRPGCGYRPSSRIQKKNTVPFFTSPFLALVSIRGHLCLQSRFSQARNTTTPRHARARPGHPRSAVFVDGRIKSGHMSIDPTGFPRQHGTGSPSCPRP